MSYHPLELSRRQLLKVGAGVGASTLLTPALYADTVDTQAHIVIIGGGAHQAWRWPILCCTP